MRVKSVVHDQVLARFQFRKPLYSYRSHLVRRLPESNRGRKSCSPSQCICKRFTAYNQCYSSGPPKALLYGRKKGLLFGRIFL